MKSPEQTKGEKIIDGLRRAKCKWCGKPGTTRACRCRVSMLLVRRQFQNWQPNYCAGPIGFLP